MSAWVMPPAAMAAQRGLTAGPDQLAAKTGACERNAVAIHGRMRTSTTAKITTSEETSTGTAGRARMAPPVAIEAATPQIEMPEASGADHSRLKPNHWRAT